MKNTLVLLLVLFFAQATSAQLHQDVYPGEQGNTLLDDLESHYKPTTVLTYKEARNEMFGDIDNVNDSIYGVYTDKPIYLNHNSSDPKGDAYSKGFNTEHTFPQSQGATGNAKSDIHHLFPTQVDVNGDRGHLPFSEINDNSTDTWYWLDYEGSSIPTANIDEYSELKKDEYFEPREAHKGNVARAMMYFYTMYHDQANSSYFQGMIPTLCAWHYQDAVDQREWDRTWAIAAVQGKPNPFVLDCTLAERSYCSDLGYHCNPDGTDDAQALVQLYGTYPNPAHLSVKMRFTLASACAKGQITVFDMMGQLIALRPMKNLVAGPNERIFDTSDWKPGFYLYTVQVDGGLASGKLVVY